MCGIHLSVWKNDHCCSLCQQFQQLPEPNEPSHLPVSSTSNLQRRGPDACRGISFGLKADESETSVHVSLQASVLQMRRDLVEQPVTLDLSNSVYSDQGPSGDDNSYYLCWNGEVYQTIDDDEAGTYETSDTRLVVDRLSEAFLACVPPTNDPLKIAHQIAVVLGKLYNAEFAFLVVRRSDGHVFYGRDSWGRRSLLRVDCSHCGSFHIASTAPSMIISEQGSENSIQNFPSPKELPKWQEIPPGMVHVTSSAQPKTIESIRFHPLERPPVPSSQLPDLLPPYSISEPPEGVSLELWNSSRELEFHLSQAVHRRMAHHHHSSTAVLFSGGLDSAVIAALAARHCHHSHTLHLYNVSFGPSFEKSADRQAALISHQVLQAQHPNKAIAFHDIIVSWEDICKHETHIRTILQPKETLMDVNIATALWFASSGGGTKSAVTNDKRPRVLLLGMGADELLGGYGRHRTAFERGGSEELEKELQMDQSRFWERNLGRDDRIVADHGSEARFPFLDYHVTQLVQNLPLSSICDFSLPPGQGDKRVLRLVAMRLGLDHASGLVKRAVQFGSRISHLSDSKRFGSRRKAKGKAVVKTPA